MPSVASRYTAVAMALHWLIALGILCLVVMGLVMVNATLPPMLMFKLYQLHKSIGITVLLLAVVRILWRIGHRPPPLPATMTPFEVLAAEGAHAFLYLLMFGLPITGWIYVSVAPISLPTVLYGIVPWPHLTFLTEWIDKATLAEISQAVHVYGAWVLIAVVAAHALAALRHHFIIKDDVLVRMLPRLAAGRSRPGAVKQSRI